MRRAQSTPLTDKLIPTWIENKTKLKRLDELLINTYTSDTLLRPMKMLLTTRLW